MELKILEQDLEAINQKYLRNSMMINASFCEVDSKAQTNLKNTNPSIENIKIQQILDFNQKRHGSLSTLHSNNSQMNNSILVNNGKTKGSFKETEGNYSQGMHPHEKSLKKVHKTKQDPGFDSFYNMIPVCNSQLIQIVNKQHDDTTTQETIEDDIYSQEFNINNTIQQQKQQNRTSYRDNNMPQPHNLNNNDFAAIKVNGPLSTAADSYDQSCEGGNSSDNRIKEYNELDSNHMKGIYMAIKHNSNINNIKSTDSSLITFQANCTQGSLSPLFMTNGFANYSICKESCLPSPRIIQENIKEPKENPKFQNITPTKTNNNTRNIGNYQGDNNISLTIQNLINRLEILDSENIELKKLLSNMQNDHNKKREIKELTTTSHLNNNTMNAMNNLKDEITYLKKEILDLKNMKMSDNNEILTLKNQICLIKKQLINDNQEIAYLKKQNEILEKEKEKYIKYNHEVKIPYLANVDNSNKEREKYELKILDLMKRIDNDQNIIKALSENIQNLQKDKIELESKFSNAFGDSTMAEKRLILMNQELQQQLLKGTKVNTELTNELNTLKEKYEKDRIIFQKKLANINEKYNILTEQYTGQLDKLEKTNTLFKTKNKKILNEYTNSKKNISILEKELRKCEKELSNKENVLNQLNNANIDMLNSVAKDLHLSQSINRSSSNRLRTLKKKDKDLCNIKSYNENNIYKSLQNNAEKFHEIFSNSQNNNQKTKSNTPNRNSVSSTFKNIKFIGSGSKHTQSQNDVDMGYTDDQSSKMWLHNNSILHNTSQMLSFINDNISDNKYQNNDKNISFGNENTQNLSNIDEEGSKNLNKKKSVNKFTPLKVCDLGTLLKNNQGKKEESKHRFSIKPYQNDIENITFNEEFDPIKNFSIDKMSSYHSRDVSSSIKIKYQKQKILIRFDDHAICDEIVKVEREIANLRKDYNAKQSICLHKINQHQSKSSKFGNNMVYNHGRMKQYHSKARKIKLPELAQY